MFTYQMLQACNLCKLSKSDPDKIALCCRALRQMHTLQFATTRNQVGNIRPLKALLATCGTRLSPGPCSNGGYFYLLSLRYVKKFEKKMWYHFTSPTRSKGPTRECVHTSLYYKPKTPDRIFKLYLLLIFSLFHGTLDAGNPTWVAHCCEHKHSCLGWNEHRRACKYLLTPWTFLLLFTSCLLYRVSRFCLSSSSRYQKANRGVRR